MKRAHKSNELVNDESCDPDPISSKDSPNQQDLEGFSNSKIDLENLNSAIFVSSTFFNFNFFFVKYSIALVTLMQ